MATRKVCCCSAQTWSRVIAWIQVVACSILIVELITVLVHLAAVSKEEVKHTTYVNNIPKQRGMSGGLILSFILVLLMILLYASGIAFAVLLLRGSYRRTPKFIRWWIIYACVATVLALLLVIIDAVAGNYNSILGMLVAAGCTILINGFCIWVVRLHLREMEADLEFGPAEYV